MEFAGRISNDFPAVKVIACSAEDRRCACSPFHHGESYLSNSIHKLLQKP